ncbi:MAG: hypothetical protein DRJ05_11715 [Bacteroidetes bacterium]|nr:MAG: hypothetical protein DRJ05_11715 [Bacteroidota bacterium]
MCFYPILTLDSHYLPLNGSYDLSNYDLANMFEQLVYLDGVSEINFTACIFSQNIHFTQDSPKEWLGKGVFANNSTFHISSFWDSKCSFSNFEYGIFTISSWWWASGFTSIWESEFNNNVCGIYASLPDNYSSPLEIVLNDFVVKHELNADYATGIYLDNTSSFFVEENTFTGDIGSIYNTELISSGIVINDCGENNNKLYNNILNNLDLGIRAQNKNRSRDGINGLSILCNDYSTCLYDTYIIAKNPLKSDYGIVVSQGNGTPHTTSPAGNTFHDAELPPENDIFNLTNEITYWYHYNYGEYNIKPLWFDTDVVTLGTNYEEPQTYSKEYSCPHSEFTQAGRDAQSSKAEMLASEASADSLNNELSILVDAGDTELLNDDVQTSWPDETMELRADLLDASPYLSDTVMISAADKEDVLPNAILTEILVANPQSAKSNKVMKAVDERDTLLTQTQFDQVMAGKFIAGVKEKLESRITAALSKRSFAMKNLIIAWHQDSLVNASDSIINLLEDEDEPLAKYVIVDLFLNMHDTTSAKTVYDNINTEFDLDNQEYNYWLNYKDWLDYKVVQVSNEKSFNGPDSLQIVMLYQLHNNTDDQLHGLLRNLLRFSDTLSYSEPYLLADTSMKTSKVKWRPAGGGENNKELLVYPNPSKDYVIVDYSGIESQEPELIIDVYNAEGKLTRQIPIRKHSGFKVINTEYWKPGFYIFSIKNSASILGIAKVTILH